MGKPSQVCHKLERAFVNDMDFIFRIPFTQGVDDSINIILLKPTLNTSRGHPTRLLFLSEYE
jgi:hypothetical protein